MRPNRAAVAVACLFPASLPAFGTVDEVPRLCLAALGACVAGAALLGWGRVHRSLLLVWVPAWFAQMWMLWSFVPVGPEMRARLQPGLAPLLDELLGVAGSPTHLLAIQPRMALVAFAYGSSVLLLALAAAATVRSSTDARAVALILAVSGAIVVPVAWIHHAFGVVTPFGADRGLTWSFAPFVNGNHAGAALAALIPLASSIARTGRPISGAFLTLLLTAGLVTSRSRGGLVAGALGIVVWLLADPDRRARICAGVLSLGGAVLVLATGPETTLRRLSAWIDPYRAIQPDVTGGRLELWRDAWTLFDVAPWIGLGSGGFEDAFKTATTAPLFAKVSQAHQDPLQILIEHGWVAAAALATASLTLLWLGTRACAGRDRPSMTSGFLASTVVLGSYAGVDFPLRIGALATLGAVCAGSLLGVACRREPALGRNPTLAVRGSAVVLVAAAIGIPGFLTLRGNDVGHFADAHQVWEGGDTLFRENRTDAALDAYRRALAIRPLDQHALLRVAKAWLALGDTKAARSTLELAVRAHPRWYYAWLNLARVRGGGGDTEAALAAWSELLELEPPPGATWTDGLEEALALPIDRTAAILVLTSDLPQRRCEAADWLAERDLDAGEALLWAFSAEDPTCTTMLATRQWSWGRPDAALATIRTAPDSCERQILTGRLLLELGNPVLALDPLNRARIGCPPSRHAEVTLHLDYAHRASRP